MKTGGTDVRRGTLSECSLAGEVGEETDMMKRKKGGILCVGWSGVGVREGDRGLIRAGFNLCYQREQR